MVPLALSTQTAGSIVRPASYCGVVGFKASYGLIDIAGVTFDILPEDLAGDINRDTLPEFKLTLIRELLRLDEALRYTLFSEEYL
jgi:hypothetical protein